MWRRIPFDYKEGARCRIWTGGHERKGSRANPTAKYDLVAICTEHILTDYKIAPPRKATAQYALLAISSVRESAAGAEEPGCIAFMVDRMQLIDGADYVVACLNMFGKLAHARSELSLRASSVIEVLGASSPRRQFHPPKTVRR